MTDVLAKHVARQTALKRLDAFYAGEGVQKGLHERAAEMAPPFDKRGLPLETTLPTLRKMFWEVREVGAYIVPAELPDEKREMLARPVNSLVADGLLTDAGGKWAITELGVTAIGLLEESGDVSKIRNFVEPVLFPEGRPSRLALEARLGEVLDRATEVRGCLDEVFTYEMLCVGRNQSPW